MQCYRSAREHSFQHASSCVNIQMMCEMCCCYIVLPVEVSVWIAFHITMFLLLEFLESNWRRIQFLLTARSNRPCNPESSRFQSTASQASSFEGEDLTLIIKNSPSNLSWCLVISIIKLINQLFSKINFEYIYILNLKIKIEQINNY